MIRCILILNEIKHFTKKIRLINKSDVSYSLFETTTHDDGDVDVGEPLLYPGVTLHLQ